MENKDKKEKVIIWEGFKKEIPWIIFWLLIGIMAYGYYQDKQICEQVLADPCDACYKLNTTLMDTSYIIKGNDVILNSPIIPIEDKNPNDRTISYYK